jgi:hypothetical protein
MAEIVASHDRTKAILCSEPNEIIARFYAMVAVVPYVRILRHNLVTVSCMLVMTSCCRHVTIVAFSVQPCHVPVQP